MSKLHLLLFLAWIAAAVCPAVAQETVEERNAPLQPKISADQKIVLDQATGQMVARGKARLEYGTLLLLADEIRYLSAKGQAIAKGKVILTRGEVRILADEVEYLLSEERLSAQKVRFGHYPIAGESESLVGSLKGLSTAKDATIYLFEPKPLEPNFRAKEIAFDEEAGILKAHGLRLRIGQATVLGLPKLETQRRKSPFEATLSAGHDDHLGASVEIHSLFDVRSDLRIGGSLEGYTKRGVLLGPEVRYGSDKSSVRGSFSSGFIKDENPVGLDVQGTVLPDDRGFLDWSHQQRFNETLSFAAQVEWRQDSEVFRDFRQEIFQFDQWNDSFAELTYSKDNTMASLFARAQPNQFTDQIERKPEIGVYLLPTELFDSSVYHSASLEWVGMEESNGNGSAGIESDRADLTYHLSRYFKIAPWLSLMPSTTYRMARYWDALGSDNSLTRHFGEFGLDARIPFHAQFEVQNELWEIDGLRHKGSILFQYRYLNDSKDGDRDRVPLLDRRYFDPNLAPLDLKEIRYLDDLADRNLIRIGIENQLQTRAEKYGSRDLAALRIYQDLPLDPEPDQESDDAFFSEVEVKPAQWIAFGLQAKIDTKQGDLQQLALESRLLDADLAELSLSFLRLEDRSNQYRLLGFRRLNERRELQSGLQFDAKTGNLTRATVGVYSRLSDSWDLAYLLTHRKGTAREDDLAFRLGLRMLEF